MSNVVPFPTDLPELDARYVRFAEEYLIDFRPRRAAQRAGINPNIAEALLEDPRVRAIVNEGRRRVSDRVNISVSNILHNLALIANANMQDYGTFDEPLIPGAPRRLRIDFESLTEDQWACIKSISFTQFGPKIELYDKAAANVQLGKYFALWTENVNMNAQSKPFEMIRSDMTPEKAAELYQETLRSA